MRIIKRKKGNQEYYYLQHSYRQDGKVITKELYLGLEIPSNIEDLKLDLGQEEKNNLYKRLNQKKDAYRKDWKRYPASAKEKELEEISIAFTYNTNAIEGSTITLDETREIIHDKIAPKKYLHDITETEKHSKTFLEMLKSKDKISNALILNWHKNIFSDTKSDIAGVYREHGVRVLDYIAPDWQDVKDLMNELIKYINSSKLNSVELAGIAHYRFEKIHPFGDGNGRIGRLLMNKILWDSGYPMLIIENKKRRVYYKALKKDEDGFLKYFFRVYVKVHGKK